MEHNEALTVYNAIIKAAKASRKFQNRDLEKFVELHPLDNGDVVCRLFGYYYIWSMEDWEKHCRRLFGVNPVQPLSEID